jgi:hypothetical protein
MIDKEKRHPMAARLPIEEVLRYNLKSGEVSERYGAALEKRRW